MLQAVKEKLIWLNKRLKSKTIWLTSISPAVLIFMQENSSALKSILNENYTYIILLFSFLSWIAREITTNKLDDK